MTNAPIYQPQVRDRPAASTKLRNFETPTSKGAGVGQALQQAGEAVFGLRDVALLKRELENDAQRRVAQETFRDAKRESLYGEDGYLRKTGTDALGQSRETFEQRIEKARQAAAAELPPAQRERYLSETAAMTDAAKTKAAQHEGDESRRTVVESREAEISGATEDALDNWKDDDLFERSLAEAVERQNNLAALTGASEEVRKRAADELIAETVRNRAVLIASEDPVAAEQYIRDEDRLSAEQKLELNETLKPLVLEHRVNEMMSQFIVRGGGDTGGEPWLGALGGAESSGGANRQNPRSSAGGMFGYTDGTWVANVRRAARAGALPAELATASRGELIARKNDDAMASAVARHDASIYDGMIAKAGADPTPQNRYIIHHFGEGAGPAILREMQRNPGMPAATMYKRMGQAGHWNAIVAANPGISHGDTVADLHAYAGHHIGRGARQAGQASVQFDYAAAYDYAQSIEDPALRTAFLQQVESREAVDAKRRQAARGAVVSEATERYFTTGESDLSLAEKLALGIEGYNTFRGMVANAERGTLVSDPEIYNTLSDMSASQDVSTLRDFAAEGSIEKYIDKLSQEDYRRMVERRAQVRGELEGTDIEKGKQQELFERVPEAAVPIKDKHLKSIDSHLARTGADDSKEQEYAQQRYAMQQMLQQQMVEFYQREKRVPEDAEIDDMLFAQTLPIATGGGIMGNATAPLFNMETLPDGAPLDVRVEYESVPLSDRTQLTARLAAVLGRTPTEDEVVTAYETSVLTKGQLTPTGFAEEIEGLEEIPQEAYEYLSTVSGKSDAEIQALWEDYLRKVFTGEISPQDDISSVIAP